MKEHFLTIRRYYEKDDIIQEREYWYNPDEVTIEEVFVYKNPYNFEVEITGKERTKNADINNFVINLKEMVSHPGVIYKNEEFIDWYADAILNDEFGSDS